MVVRYTNPTSAEEAAARFDLVEDNGDRVMIRLRCDLPIPPVEVVAKADVVEVAEGD